MLTSPCRSTRYLGCARPMTERKQQVQPSLSANLTLHTTYRKVVAARETSTPGLLSVYFTVALLIVLPDCCGRRRCERSLLRTFFDVIRSISKLGSGEAVAKLSELREEAILNMATTRQLPRSLPGQDSRALSGETWFHISPMPLEPAIVHQQSTAHMHPHMSMHLPSHCVVVPLPPTKLWVQIIPNVVFGRLHLDIFGRLGTVAHSNVMFCKQRAVAYSTLPSPLSRPLHLHQFLSAIARIFR
jgi:hypothetical protein